MSSPHGRQRRPVDPRGLTNAKEKSLKGYRQKPLDNESPQAIGYGSDRIDDTGQVVRSTAQTRVSSSANLPEHRDGPVATYLTGPGGNGLPHTHATGVTLQDTSPYELQFMDQTAQNNSEFDNVRQRQPLGVMGAWSPMPHQGTGIEHEAIYPYPYFPATPRNSICGQDVPPALPQPRIGRGVESPSTFTPPISPVKEQRKRLPGHTRNRPQAPSTSHTNVAAKPGSSKSTTSKRKAQEIEDMASGDGSEATNPTKRQAVQVQLGSNEFPSSSRSRLACPLYLANPQKYPNCLLRNKLKTPGQVKQHILRSHEQPLYCPICCETFKGDGANNRYDRHCQKRICRDRKRAIEGLSSDRLRALRRLCLRKKGNPLQNYNKIWEAVFPETPAPEDPYIQGGGAEYVKFVNRETLGHKSAVGTKAIQQVLVSHTFYHCSPAENAMKIAQHVRYAIDGYCEAFLDDAFDDDSDAEPDGEDHGEMRPNHQAVSQEVENPRAGRGVRQNSAELMKEGTIGDEPPQWSALHTSYSSPIPRKVATVQNHDRRSSGTPEQRISHSRVSQVVPCTPETLPGGRLPCVGAQVPKLNSSATVETDSLQSQQDYFEQTEGEEQNMEGLIYDELLSEMPYPQLDRYI